MTEAPARRGYTFKVTCRAMPNQAEGRRVSDDRPYYFRARHGYWSLELGEPGWDTDYCAWPADADSRPELLMAEGQDERAGWWESDEPILALLDQHLAAP